MSNTICPNCGVELDKGLKICPLCKDNNLPEDEVPDKSNIRYPTEILKMSERERKRYAWELSAIISVSAILVSLIVDMVIVKGLSWSLYSVITIVAIWNCLTLFIFANKRIWIIATGLLLNLLGMLVLIDLIEKPVNWFVQLGLPFTTSIVLLFTILLILIKKANFKGFNILALILISVSIQCMIFELFTDLYLQGKVTIGWSAITASAIVPFSGILMFIHYRLKRGKNLGSYFHV